VNSIIKSLYRVLIHLKNRGELCETGLDEFIEREKINLCYDVYGSPAIMNSLITFLHKYQIKQ